MTYAELQDYAISDGAHIMFCYVNDVTSGIFMTMFFLAVWLVATFGSFFMTKRTTGSGDFPVSMSLGSFTTFVLSILLRLISCPNNNLVSDFNLGVIIGITFLSVIFLLFSRE